MARWAKGEQAVQFLVDRGRLESFEAEDLAVLAEALIGRAARRVETTAAAALAGGDVDGAASASAPADNVRPADTSRCPAGNRPEVPLGRF
jgi:hypothetical protein